MPAEAVRLAAAGSGPFEAGEGRDRVASEGHRTRTVGSEGQVGRLE